MKRIGLADHMPLALVIRQSAPDAAEDSGPTSPQLYISLSYSLIFQA